jgi:hypothetical protein
MFWCPNDVHVLLKRCFVGSFEVHKCPGVGNKTLRTFKARQ